MNIFILIDIPFAEYMDYFQGLNKESIVSSTYSTDQISFKENPTNCNDTGEVRGIKYNKCNSITATKNSFNDLNVWQLIARVTHLNEFLSSLVQQES